MKEFRNRPCIVRIALAFCLLAASTGASLAVTDEEIFRDFRFNLSNPGARSLGLGGAFIAVADDATAALANPAGLMLLARPEFFTEMRDRTQDSSSIEQTIGGVNQIESTTDPRAVFSPSFFSYVYPWKRFALGLSRVELNNTSNSTLNRFTLTDPNGRGVFEFRGVGRIQVENSVWNVSGAVKITDKLSVGATAAFGILNARAGVENYFVDSPGIFVDPNVVANPTLLLYTTDIQDQDTDVTFNVGVHWRPFEKISFGAVYRGGMEFEVSEGIGNEEVLAFLFGTLSGTTGNPLATTFNTPASWGAGVAWRPMSQLTVSADWLHINYTDLLDGFQAGINVLTLGDTNAVFTIEDADEFHLGGEYVFSVGTVPLAVRAGVFSDHNSRIFADFTNGFSFFSTNDTFPPRDTTTHYTIGTGVVVKERFQIDAAADLSDIANEYVLSTIFRF